MAYSVEEQETTYLDKSFTTPVFGAHERSFSRMNPHMSSKITPPTECLAATFTKMNLRCLGPRCGCIPCSGFVVAITISISITAPATTCSSTRASTSKTVLALPRLLLPFAPIGSANNMSITAIGPVGFLVIPINVLFAYAEDLGDGLCNLNGRGRFRTRGCRMDCGTRETK